VAADVDTDRLTAADPHPDAYAVNICPSGSAHLYANQYRERGLW
jgi:hypothetical protein